MLRSIRAVCLLAALPATAIADDVVTIDLSGTPVRVQSPDGYCPLGRERPRERRIHARLSAAYDHKVKLLVVFAECDQIKAFNAKRRATIDDYVIVAEPRPADGLTYPYPPASFAKMMADAYRRSIRQPAGPCREQCFERIAASLPALKTNRMRFLGVIRTNKHAMFTGSALRAQVHGRARMQLSVEALGLVARKLIATYFIAVRNPNDAMATLRQALTRSLWYREAIVRTNLRPAPKSTHKQAKATAR